MTGQGVDDTWTWEAAADGETPAALTLTRKDGTKVEVGAGDKVGVKQ
ncbi:MAG: hypothetical protein M5U26_27250 [Planctomycetota bacterium]|nr:hypothetical protein [Planctomycetota bacterium]